ncbi:MAG: hypothetical protein ACRD9Y_25840 [Blastocatellia bacterium]
MERLFEFIRQIFTLTENQRRQQDEIHKLQQQLRDSSRAHADETRALRSSVERLEAELRHNREHEEAERKILKLELENYLLRQERALPPAKPQPLPEPETDDQKEGTEKPDEQ